MKPNCIDVSTWQGRVDYAKVKAAGIRVVIIRAGYGNAATQVDNQFYNNYNGATAAGLSVGVYWYSYASGISDAEREARACLSVLNGRKLNLPIYFDMEESSIARLGKATCTAMAVKFCETVRAAGYKAGVYANPNWFLNYLDYAALRAKYSIWLAHWASSHSLACDIWQYGEDGRIDGISGAVDVNIIENAALLGSAPTQAKPTAATPTVGTVQSWLNENYSAGLVVDSIYGRLTKAALVKALQTELNRQYGAKLAVDGIFGACTSSAVRNLQLGSQGNLTRILQALLLCRGYGTGGFDGIFGTGTKSAVLSFQYKNGLATDGIAGRETFRALCK